MQFVSFEFLIFFPIVCLLYYLIPQKFRYIWLLIASYVFYMSINPGYALLLAFSTLTTYGCALGMSLASGNGGKKAYLIACLVVNIGLLCFFKYASLLSFNIVLPVGMSFYIFQALGYLIDVYKGKIDAEKNIARYALFVSFFPQIMSGPIERAGNMLPQFKESKNFDYENMRSGLLQMMWGYFMKMIVADRMAIIVATVFDSYDKYYGTASLVASILYTFEIYCDFAGYSNIAIGAAKVMGYDLMKNFDSPYLARSISEFWRRWHISLSSWFKDYLYIPLGGNRKGIVRKYVNILIVFIVSGMWHGQTLAFVFWGLLHGLYQVVGALLKPVRDKLVEILRIDRESFSHKLFKMLFTFMLVNIAWIFFRAYSFKQAFGIVSHLFVMKPWVLTDGTLYTLGLDRPNFLLMVFGAILLIIVDIANYKNIVISDKIKAQQLWLRWIIYIVAALFIIVCGVWGPGYDSTSFIYSQF